MQFLSRKVLGYPLSSLKFGDKLYLRNFFRGVDIPILSQEQVYQIWKHAALILSQTNVSVCKRMEKILVHLPGRWGGSSWRRRWGRWMRGRRGSRRASRWGGRRTRARPRTWWRSSPPRGPACRRRGSSRTSPALPVGEIRRWENLNYSTTRQVQSPKRWWNGIWSLNLLIRSWIKEKTYS